MRGIPGTSFFIFLGIIILIEIVAFLSIMQLFKNNKKKKLITVLYWTLSAGFLILWFTAFWNPSAIRETDNYPFFYFVISTSFLNLVPKFIINCFFVLALLLLIFKVRNGSRLVLMSGLIISIGTMLTIGSGILWGRKAIRVEQVELPIRGLPEQLDGKMIVHLSDTHLGSFKTDVFLKKCAAVVNELSPDLLLFTGDMVNNYYSEMIGFKEELSAMKAQIGKYAILGNHDYGDYSDWESEELKNQNHEQLCHAIEDAGFQLLLNDAVKIKIADTSFYLIGVENWGHPPFPQYARLEEAIKNVPEEAFKVLLSHDPAHWEAEVLPESNINITLSGHTHGAQVGFRLAGIEFSPMFFIQKFWGGLYESEGRYLYVNRGLGSVGLLARIDMRPEITQIKLLSDIVEPD